MDIGTIARQPAITCARDATIRDAALLMRKHNVGSVVVTDAHDRPIGILTDRDIALRGVAEDRDPSTAVESLASQDLEIAYEDDELIEVATRMASRAVRRIPIMTRNGELRGVAAVDDMVLTLARELARVSHAIEREVG